MLDDDEEFEPLAIEHPRVRQYIEEHGEYIECRRRGHPHRTLLTEGFVQVDRTKRPQTRATHEKVELCDPEIGGCGTVIRHPRIAKVVKGRYRFKRLPSTY